jgi:hypothetical protein
VRRPLPNNHPALDAALARAEATVHRVRARSFAAARLPYRDEDHMTKVETFPQTDLGSAAAAVVANLDSCRPVKWPPKALVEGAPAPKIAKPGIYAMSLDDYHSDCCAGPSVSSGGLRTIEAQSLAHFWSGSYLNPDREPFDPSKSMILGSAAHHLLLGEVGFSEKFVVRPDHWSDWRKDAAKEWKAEQEAAGKTVLVPDQLTAIKGISASLGRHPLIRDGLMAGAVEQSMIWKDRETGLWLKARPDVRAASGSVICDLKTTTDASPGACERTMDSFGYHMQLALAGMGMEALFGVTPGNSDYVFVFVETEAPWCVSVRPVDIQDIGYGRMQIRRALRKLATAFETNSFPGYENDLTTLSLPAWRRKQLEAEVKGGLLRPEDAA